MALADPAGAVTLIVDASGGGDFYTIQEAIDAAYPYDEIEVWPGTYNEAINFGGMPVRLYSRDGPEVTTIDGTGYYHVVQCINSEGPDTILEGFTITGGNANGSYPHNCGGGMYNYISSPTVIDCNFFENRADADGGGMYNESGSPTVTNCIFSNNQATQCGGGMYNDQSCPTITNCMFNNNTATENGGGMYNFGSSPTVTNCTFSDNSASRGGGIYNDGDSSPKVTNCTLSANTAAHFGGGMYNFGSSPTVTNCTFSGNSATENDGGGMCNTSSSPTVTNCTFSGNSADYGGGMCNWSSNPIVTNCTFSGNSADYGGGMCNNSSSPMVTNSILWGDTPDEIVDYYSSTTVTYSDVRGGWSGAGTNNIDADPRFVNAAADNLRLLPLESPCVDAGDNNSIPPDTADLDNDGNTAEPIPLDADGTPRVVDVDGNGTAVVDMGAYESPPLIHNITQDTLYSTIQSAINHAHNGDQIEVRPGTYYEAINFIGRAIRLYSSEGPETTIIDGVGTDGVYHVVQCGSYEDANTILEGFTITGGNANGSSWPDDCGGGMYCENSSPKVTNCKFKSNTASEGGGGMFNLNSSPTVTNCTFSNNSATFGGGMYNTLESNPTVINCIFNNNTATENGGGMYNQLSNPMVTNCTFSGNSASNGGGMYNFDDSSPKVTNCTFSGNSASSVGGGMCNENSSTTLTNCTFSGNSASNGGGMYNFDDSSPKVTNCTFSGNSATSIGGGVFNSGASSPTVTNCVLWDDTASINPEISGSATVNYSDVMGGWSGAGGNNIDADPLFADPCNPDPNLRNFRLAPGSPCIDAADNISVPADTADLDGDGNTVEPIPYDLDGHPRFIDGDCNDTDIVDMGAFEFNYAYMGDFDYNCTVDFKDFAVFAMAWLTEPPEPMWNRFCDIGIPPDDYIDLYDLDVLVDNWLADF